MKVRVLKLLSFSLSFIFVLNSSVFADNPVKLSCKSKNKMNQTISFTLVNTGAAEVQIENPLDGLTLFRWQNNQWQQIPQLGYCRCQLTPCAAPPRYMPLQPNETKLLEWNQKETWCIDQEKASSASKWAGKGKYKASIYVAEPDGGSTTEISTEFSIRGRFF